MDAGKTKPTGFEPRVAGFICQMCCDDCPQSDQLAKLESSSNLQSLIHVCSAEVGDEQIMKAFDEGADGVLICGCLVGTCLSESDNLSALRKIHHTANLLKEAGIPPERLRREWVCAPGRESLLDVFNGFLGHIRELGPLHDPVARGRAGEA
jgi:F420-non-reducing hydrogenase iron-sulfur subunit